jgi:hypothetical protein
MNGYAQEVGGHCYAAAPVAYIFDLNREVAPVSFEY